MNKRRRKTNAYGKDIRRSIGRGKKRFLSIVVITVLGTMMFSGLKAACTDLRVSADRFCDAQNLHDLCIVSTLGLTQDDVEVLQGLDGVEKAEGAYSEDVDAQIGDVTLQVTMQTLSECGIDSPYLEKGRLPETEQEAVVTEKFMEDTGAQIGDQIVITETESDEEEEEYEVDTEDLGDLDDFDFSLEDEEDDEESDTAESEKSDGEENDSASANSGTAEDEDGDRTFPCTTYTITGVVIDSTDLNNPFGSVSYRTSSTDRNKVFVLPAAAENEYYTAVYLTLDGTRELYCFSDKYENTVEGFKTFLESEIKEQREEARTEGIRDEAFGKIDDAEEEVNEKLAEALQKLEDAEQELADAREEGEQELADGEQELRDKIAEARQELADAKKEMAKELASARKKLEDADAQIAAAEQELDAGEQELNEQESNAKAQIAAGQAQIDAGYQQLADAKKQLDEQEAALSAGETQIAAARAQIDEQELAAISAIAARRQALQEELESLQNTDEEGGSGGEQADSAEENRDSSTSSSESGSNISNNSGGKSGGGDSDAASLESSEDREKRISEIQEALAALDAQEETAAEQFSQARAQIDAQEEEQGLTAAREQLDAARAAYEESSATAAAQLEEAQATLDSQSAQAFAQIAAARQQLTDVQTEIEANKKRMEEAWVSYYEGKEEAEKQIADAEKEIEDGERDGEQELADGRQELEDGLADGREQLDDGWDQYYDGAEEASEKFADARAEVEDLDMAVWYVQDRMSLSGYANVDSDAGSIEAIGTVFPIVFFIVAVLISLTTITRMVEEDRGLIGTYKSLGFTDGEIRRKYTIYAGLACATGSLIGTALAFIALPSFIFTIFHVMYLLPDYVLTFVPSYGFLGAALFLGGVLLATWSACRSELLQTPAALLRPKSPRAGSRVLLEYITPLWKRLSFLRKVTARNLFRYKKRMLMTIFGIAGCMALLLFGFAIKDSVTDLMPRQYEQTFVYDIMVVSSSDDEEELLGYLGLEEGEQAAQGSAEDGENTADTTENATGTTTEDSASIESYLSAMITSVTLSNEKDKETVTLIVVPDGPALKQYIHLRDTGGGSLALEDGAILVTQNAGNVMGFADGGSVEMQLQDLQQAEIPVTHLVQNYLGNYVYMTRSTYEQYFDDYAENGALINLSAACSDPVAYAKELGEQKGILSSLSIQEMKDQFSGAFTLINMVVYVIIVMSAALAFVVLFTLATTNIMERERELATIKVLGFYDREVHLYVDKETMILTGVGILLGIPLGWAFAQTLTAILNLPSIYLAVSLHGRSYLFAAGLTIAFALAVNLFTDRALDHIDPVEALKSVE